MVNISGLKYNLCAKINSRIETRIVMMRTKFKKLISVLTYKKNCVIDSEMKKIQ